jgi:predicted nucleotidyltransferase component of viral defense system
MSLNTAIHKSQLIRILKEIYSNPQIGAVMGFKGGTAAFLFYDLDRFSVDLDFDLLDASKKELVFNEVRGILDKFGRLKIADIKRYSLIYILAYDERALGAQNVKVEINLREFGSRYFIKSYLGIPMKVMIPEDMAANKLVALYERMGKAHRDIYDMHFMLSHNWQINHQIVERRTGMPMTEVLELCCSLVEKISSRGILNGLGEVLNDQQKTWVKNHLLDDLLFLLRLYQETHT